MPFISKEDLAEYVDFLRGRGMDNAEIAFGMQADKSGDGDEYFPKVFSRAYGYIIRAADHANQIREELEPTTSILYRSAAHPAHNAWIKS